MGILSNNGNCSLSEKEYKNENKKISKKLDKINLSKKSKKGKKWKKKIKKIEEKKDKNWIKLIITSKKRKSEKED